MSKNIVLLQQADLKDAISTIMLAFATDPGARWFSPSSKLFTQNISAYARIVADTAIEHQSAFCTEDMSGVALWLPPNVETNDEALGTSLNPGFSESEATEMQQLGELNMKYKPSDPHWYLSMIAVDPAYQSLGIGGQLMEYACNVIDNRYDAAYLEASSPRNVPFYLRYDFESLGTMQVGSSPAIVPMFRKARYSN